MVNNNRRGKVQERRARDWLRDHGFPEARRSVQYCGRHADASDLQCEGLLNLYIEVKARKTMPSVADIEEWMLIAEKDCGGKTVVLMINLPYREPAVYAREPMLGGIICYVTNKIETLIRLNQKIP